ncbi:hypothetical protein B0H14DRAFT_3546254 [Mycena olivaceomarginata]|nr:hypothetical protein B0H14DRAFT_3546254 [Mycena olivaceomarginata]
MHRGLLIPEVGERICGVAEFSTLAALARTCQAFQQPALAVLRANQKDLMQLLKCLFGTWCHLGETLQRLCIQFYPPIRRECLFYAAFVKSFIQDGRHSAQWDVYIICGSEPRATRVSLIPNLRHLTWRTPDHVLPFIPKLSLDNLYPRLTRVEIDPPRTSVSIVGKAISAALLTLNHLENLKIAYLDGPSLPAPGGLPNLHGFTYSHFLDLHLVFFSEAINSITSLLDALDKIELTFDTLDPHYPGLVCPALGRRALERHQNPVIVDPIVGAESKTLTKLYLRERISFQRHSRRSRPHAPRRLVPPSPSCANLTEVMILTANGIDIDDAFLKRMATAWPQLRTLDLSPGCQSAAGHHCPRLESLALVLDATRTDPEILRDGISNCALARLGVVESPLSSPGAVAAFFAAIFPNLQVVSSRQEGNRNKLAPGER